MREWRGYDNVAAEYYDSRHITSRNFDAATRTYLQNHSFEYPTHGFALDLGAGRGRLNEFCGIANSRIVQADVAQNMLALSARERTLARVVADAKMLPFRREAFTVVAAFLFDPFNEATFFSQVAEVLDVGGVFIGTLPHYEWGQALRGQTAASLKEAVFVLNSGERVPQPSVLSSPQHLNENIVRAGLRILKNEALTLPMSVESVSPDVESPARRLGLSVYSIPIVQLVMAIK